MGNYINDLLSKGRTPEEIFDFLIAAKIDPTNVGHLKRRVKAINSTYNEAGVENAA